jgi:hypothetical protein
VATLLAAAALAGDAAATHSDAFGADRHFVVGAGRVLLATPLGYVPHEVYLEATADPVTGETEGRLTLRNLNLGTEHVVRVTCLELPVGLTSLANIGGTVRYSDDLQVPVGHRILIQARDGGGEGATLDTMLALLLPPGPAFCHLPARATSRPLSAGSLAVHRVN